VNNVFVDPVADSGIVVSGFHLTFPSGWTTSSAEAVHQLRPSAQHPEITKG